MSTLSNASTFSPSPPSLIASRPSPFRIRSQRSSFVEIDESSNAIDSESMYSWSKMWFDIAHQHFIFHGHQNPEEMVIFYCPTTRRRVAQAGELNRIIINDVNIPNKTNILLAKLSLDGQLLAIQCSLTTIVILTIDTRRQWTITIKPSSDSESVNRIVPDGVMWSDHGGNSQDLIIATVRGLELYKISSVRGQCKLSRTISQDIYAFWYEPNHRLILLASKLLHSRTSITSSQPGALSPSGKSTLLSMNGIFLNFDKAEHLIPKFELPPPEKSPQFLIGPGISKENVALISVYGNPYCVTLQRINGEDFAALFLITKQSVVRTHVIAFPCPNTQLKLSVVDNLLVCHCRHIQRSVIYDINQPVSSKKRVKGFDDDSEYVDALLPLSSDSDIVLESAESSSPFGEQNEISVEDSTILGLINRVSDIAFQQPASSFSGTMNYARWQAFAPAWIWNSDNQTLWRLKISIKAVATSIHDPIKAVSFLIRRAQKFDALRVVYNTFFDEDQSYEAKCLIIERVKACIENHSGLSWLEAIFKSVFGPYSAYQQSKQIANSLVLSENLSSKESSVPPTNSTLKTVTTDQRASIKKPLSLAASLAAFGFGVVSSTMLTAGSGGPQTVNSSTSSPAITKKEPLKDASPLNILSLDMEPLEASIALQIFLPDITAVSAKARNTRVIGGNGAASGLRRLSRDSPLSQQNISSVNDLSALYSTHIRRNQQGELIVSQLEMISQIWLPLVNCVAIDKDTASSSSSKSPRLTLEYITWAMTTYMACLRAENIDPHPALSLLVLHTLAAQRKYKQIAKLLQQAFFSDSLDIAMAVLELADIIEDTELMLPKIKNIESTVVESQCDTIPRPSESVKLPLSAIDKLSIKSSILTLQQVALDMLWRLNELSVAIRWMLSHGKVLDAVNICSKFKNQSIYGLNPSSISASEFFSAGILSLQRIHAEKQFAKVYNQEEIVAMEGVKVEFMLTVLNFIRDWDKACLLVQSTSGKSILASECQFPNNIFDVYNSTRFKELFGFSHVSSRF